MIQEISVYPKPQFVDGKGAGILADIREFLRIESVSQVKTVKKYLLEGLSENEALDLTKRLFYEEVWQEYKINQKMFEDADKDVEIAYKPGVMNPEVASIMTVAKNLGYENLKAADVRWHFFLYGSAIKADEVDNIAGRLLMNKTTQSIAFEKPNTLLISGQRAQTVSVKICDASQADLMELSKDKLFLNLEEMRVIQAYFRDLGRDPTDCELEMLAQTWSEHCGHKTFKARLIIDGKEKEPLFSRLKEATKKIGRKDIVSAYVDNSGVIDFYDDYAICGKVETHNSPSAIEPYGGAATGSGGVFRDIMGTGTGAKTVISTDIFCFARPDLADEKIPAGTLHPRYLFKNVVAGVRDYGNCIGIPTNNGSVHFHDDFVAKPSVIVGAYGLIKKERAQKGKPRSGDLILAIGGRTGRDGIHGATFSSAEMTHRTESVNSSAVQIGNPVEEKRTFDACLEIGEKGYLRAITDCGAGGFSSAVGEMAEGRGARVYLERVPLKYAGLAPWEIWISESQERMVLAISVKDLSNVQKICSKFNVEVVVIGEFTADKHLNITYQDEQVCDLSIDFIHGGLPQRLMKGNYVQRDLKEPEFDCPKDLGIEVKKALAHLNVCSKEKIIRQYDHTVQGGGVLYSLTGKNYKSPSDAVIIEPILLSGRGLASAHGLNPVLNKIDPYYGSLWAILEAVSNMVAAGVNPEYIALIDNFIWPFPDEESLGDLDRAVDACVDASLALKMPFISGKDSLSSTYRSGDKVIKIPPVLCCSAFAKVDDINKTVSSCFKKPRNKIVLVGETKPELGGSVYYDNRGELGASVPQPDLKQADSVFRAVHACIEQGLVRACHDLSEGGLAVTVSEMCFGNRLGARIDLDRVSHTLKDLRPDYLLFSESTNRFLLEVDAENVDQVKSLLADLPFGLVGEVLDAEFLQVNFQGNEIIKIGLDELREAWEAPLKKIFGD